MVWGSSPSCSPADSAHPLLWFSRYHHSLHTLTFAAVVGVIAFALAQQKWKVGLLAMASFHLHLLEDLAGSRGPDGYPWPIPYLQPFSAAISLTWRGQWALNAWENVVLTAALLLATLWLAWRRGFSPLEMISIKADARLVATLRRRFPQGAEAGS
jgi:inner membrane protein